jgi:hypothetical protein
MNLGLEDVPLRRSLTASACTLSSSQLKALPFIDQVLEGTPAIHVFGIKCIAQNKNDF